MKGISIKQPYAQLILHGKIETRTWQTNYRGEVLICAAKDMYLYYSSFVPDSEPFAFKQEIKKILYGANVSAEFGKAIAVGTLVDVRRMRLCDEQKCFVHYGQDLFCHVYEDVRAIVPFDIRGQLNYFDVPEDIVQKIKFI